MSTTRRQPVRVGPKKTGRRPQRTGRFSSLLIVLALGLLAVAGRLVYVQLIQGETYAAIANEQRTKEIVLSPVRGMILDRDGQVLAQSVAARTIYAVPASITDKEAVSQAIAGTLGGDPASYLAKLHKEASFVYIARKVDVDTANALEALQITGLGFIDDSRRVYPGNDLASQVLGFVGVDDVGLMGLEYEYNTILAGEPGLLISERDTKGRPLLGGVTYEEPAVDGQDVILTIDKDIQYQAQIALAAAVEQWGAASGSVVVMDPNTGEILAMASVPTFNANTYSSADEESFRNRAIVDTYEPGSTIKSFTAAAVIDAGLYDAASTFELPSTLMVGGYTIHESHERSTVTWSLTEIVTNSSNVGAATLGMALGNEGLYGYLARFGFADAEGTGVDYPGEAVGTLASPEDWSASSIATISFGQGMSTTPLQLARALAAIANGGELVTPHFLKELPEDDSAGPVWPRTTVLDADTAATMRQVLSDVVNEGTGSGAAVPGYQVAGKTGTAQKARTDGKSGYAAGKYVASFSGFLPAGDPQVLIVVVIDEPTNGYYGGTVAAPVFSALGAFCMEHLGIAPDAAPAADAGAVTGESQASGR